MPPMRQYRHDCCGDASLAWAFYAKSAADSTLHVCITLLCKRRIDGVDFVCVGTWVAIICCMLMGLSN